MKHEKSEVQNSLPELLKMAFRETCPHQIGQVNFVNPNSKPFNIPLLQTSSKSTIHHGTSRPMKQSFFLHSISRTVLNALPAAATSAFPSHLW
jgi:hypothetical protein